MKTLLNKDFSLPEDGFFQIVPVGEFPISHGGEQFVQIVDREAVASMANRFAALEQNEDFCGLLVDFDHFSEDSSRPSEAAGWIVAMQNREDGLYAQIRWSDVGEAAVKGGRYRFCSPTWLPSQCASLGDNRVRPLEVRRVALTNAANMAAGMKPLTNRLEPDASAPGSAVAQQKPEGKHMDYKAMLLQELGLPPEATDEQIQAAMGKAKESVEASQQEVAAMTNRATTAEAKLTQLEKADLEAKVEQDLDTHKGVIKNRETVKAALMLNREGTLKVLEALAIPAPQAARPSPMMNRADAKPPVTAENDQPMRNRERDQLVEQVMKDKNITVRSQAWELAARQRPDLFS